MYRNISTVIIALLIIAAAILEFRSTKRILSKTEQIAVLTEAKAALQSKYDSLLNARRKITIVYDTVYDTVYMTKLTPYKTDSLIKPDSAKQERNFYRGVVEDTNIRIEYHAQTLGELENINLAYRLAKKYTTVESILYIDKPINIPVWYAKRHLYIASSLSYIEVEPTTRLVVGVDAIYMNKENLLLKVGYGRSRSANIYNIGVGLKVF